jgi:hypothetical protein
MSEETKSLEGAELEKALCCICNGTGIKAGENPMCMEHYQSEVLDKKTDESHPMSIQIHWDADEGYFQIKFMEGEQAVFCVQLSPKSFEKLSHDMIRTTKNYNLMQAKQYQESLKDGKKEEVVDAGIAEGGSIPDMPRADLPSEAQPNQS